MRFSKAQMVVIEALQNGGYLWLASGHPYLATKDKDGRVKSEHVHGKVFNSLKEAGVLYEDPNYPGRYYLK